MTESAVGGLGTVRQRLYRSLSLMQAWLSDERFSACQMVFVTESAVAARLEDDLADLAAAPLWGLVRSGQSEHLDRFPAHRHRWELNLAALPGCLVGARLR